MGNPNVTLNLGLLMTKELNYKGSFRYGVRPTLRLYAFCPTYLLQPGDYPLAISLVANGKIDLKPLVTHRYDSFISNSDCISNSTTCRFNFEDAITAFKATRNGKSDDGKGVIKVIINGPEAEQ